MTQTLSERATDAAVIAAATTIVQVGIWAVAILIGVLFFKAFAPGTFGALVRVLKGIDKTLAALNRNLDRANAIAEKASGAAVYVKQVAVDAAGNMRAAGGTAVDGLKEVGGKFYNAGGAAAEYGSVAVDGLIGAAGNVGHRMADAAKGIPLPAMPMNFMRRDAGGPVGDQ